MHTHIDIYETKQSSNMNLCNCSCTELIIFVSEEYGCVSVYCFKAYLLVLDIPVKLTVKQNFSDIVFLLQTQKYPTDEVTSFKCLQIMKLESPPNPWGSNQ